MPRLYTANGQDLGEVISALQKCIRRGLEREAMYWATELLTPDKNGRNYRAYLWKRLFTIANEDIGIANPFAIVLIDTLWRRFDEFYVEKKWGPCKLMLANAILFMCRGTKTRLADHFQCVILQEKFQEGVEYEIPDFALDKHTGKGKKMKRGWKHWREEGCKLDRPGKIRDQYEDRAFELWPKLKERGFGKGVGDDARGEDSDPGEGT